MRVYDVHAPKNQGPAAADQQAFLIGIAFHEAAIRSAREVVDRDGAPVIALCPMVVNYAFAAELYLKSLMPKAPRGHRLNVLFAKLEPSFRDAITVRYESRTGRLAVDLQKDILALSNLFVEWRYVFEGEGQVAHSNLLIAFTKAVYETIRTSFPAWPVNEEQDEYFRLAYDETMTVANFGGGTFLHVIDGTGLLNQPDA